MRIEANHSLWMMACAVIVCACAAEGETGPTCQVGEMVQQDSNGTKYCAPANGGGGTTSDAVIGRRGDGGAASDAGGSAIDTLAQQDPWWQCPPKLTPGGAHHGKKCTQDSDCLYGRCMKGGFLTSYDDAVSYCTKNNACTGAGSGETAPCGVDSGAPSGVQYAVAFEKSKSGGNPKRTSVSVYKVCARQCKSDAECAEWNPEMPDCILASTDYVSVGVYGVCGKNTLK